MAVQVTDGQKIHMAIVHGNASDVGRPDPIGLINGNVFEQIRIDFVGLMGLTVFGFWFWINLLSP